MNAVCKCNEMSESDTVLAVKGGILDFCLKDWGIFTWVLTLLCAAVTGGAWFGAVIAYNVAKIFSPRYRCNICDEILENDQLREEK